MRLPEDCPEFEALFDAGLQAVREDDLTEAERLFKQALAMVDESTPKHLAIVHGQLGFIDWLRERFDLAESHYRRCVSLTPRSELASLGLFHVLVNQGRWKDALEEMVRLLEERDSKEYRELLVDGYGDGMSPAEQELIRRARELLRKHERGSSPMGTK